MKIPQRPHRVKYRASQKNTTSFAGLKPIMDLAQKLGILKDLDERLTVKKRRRGIAPVDFVMSAVSTLLCGGEHLSDLDVLRQERATRDHLYGLSVPAATTAGEYLRKFSAGHVRQLESVIGRAIRRARSLMGGSGVITLDVDSSIFEVHGYLKEGARYGYKGVRGLHPLLCFWSETRLLIGSRLRSGNVTSAEGAVSFLRECLGRLGDVDRVRVRMDAGFYDRRIVDYLAAAGHGFSISAKLTSRLLAAIVDIPDEQWKMYPWEEHAEWAEMRYQPIKWSKPYRLLVKRTPYYEKDQLVLGRYFYTAVITNLRGSGSSLTRYHLARGGAENYIEEFKNGLGARLLPSQQFSANWAWLIIGQLAYNLAQWFKLLLLPKREHSHQLKKLRLNWICVGARIIRSGRRLTLALARGPDVTKRFEQIQAAIAAL